MWDIVDLYTELVLIKLHILTSETAARFETGVEMSLLM